MNIIANDIDKKGKKRKSKKIQGGICLFPFKYKGINYNDCVNGESVVGSSKIYIVLPVDLFDNSLASFIL